MADGEAPRAYTARGRVDGEDWDAVAVALNARMARLRIGQQQLADRSGVSVSTLRQIQRGAAGRRVQNATLTAVARALDWPDDHLIRVLVGTARCGDQTDDRFSEILASVRALQEEIAALTRRLNDYEDHHRRTAP